MREVKVHHVASVAAAAGCTEEALHTEDVLRWEVHEGYSWLWWG
jgi:hypothetical protein